MWDYAHLRDIALAALQGERDRLAAEQGHRSIDALPELALHPLLADAFACEGLGAHREVHYPRTAGGLRRSQGDRCDLVLTTDPAASLMDTARVGTIFEDVGLPPDEACWIEIKAVHQFGAIKGVASPNKGYSGLLQGAVIDDVRRLAADAALRHAAVLMVLFTRGAEEARNDLEAWAHRCLDKGLPIRPPLVGELPIPDLLGNSLCTVAITRIAPTGANCLTKRRRRAKPA